MQRERAARRCDDAAHLRGIALACRGLGRTRHRPGRCAAPRHAHPLLLGRHPRARPLGPPRRRLALVRFVGVLGESECQLDGPRAPAVIETHAHCRQPPLQCVCLAVVARRLGRHALLHEGRRALDCKPLGHRAESGVGRSAADAPRAAVAPGRRLRAPPLIVSGRRRRAPSVRWARPAEENVHQLRLGQLGRRLLGCAHALLLHSARDLLALGCRARARVICEKRVALHELVACEHAVAVVVYLLEDRSDLVVFEHSITLCSGAREALSCVAPTLGSTPVQIPPPADCEIPRAIGRRRRCHRSCQKPGANRARRACQSRRPWHQDLSHPRPWAPSCRS
mmetsp:Transcript_6768/g.17741  ORF Transcript_6768/g.17741 Transcript_6768/m.17741 type:complete len:339 (-) Transcript_6768:272-1288(-)